MSESVVKQTGLKSKTVRISNITIGSSGYTNISSYKPSGMNHFLFAVLYYFGNVSTKDALSVTGDGNFVTAKGGATINFIDVTYFYTD